MAHGLYEPVPQVAFGEEALNLVELDVGVLGSDGGGTGDPPVGAGQAGGQVRPGTWWARLVRVTGLGLDVPVRRLPQPDQAGSFAEYNGVIPPPDHRFRAVRCGRDGHEMTG